MCMTCLTRQCNASFCCDISGSHGTKYEDESLLGKKCLVVSLEQSDVSEVSIASISRAMNLRPEDGGRIECFSANQQSVVPRVQYGGETHVALYGTRHNMRDLEPHSSARSLRKKK
jgi:hypothetical protein